MNYVITPASVIFTTDAGKSLTVSSDNDLYKPLRDAILSNDMDRANELASVDLNPLLGEFGKVSVYGGHVTYDGIELSNYLVSKILSANDKEPFANFLNNVMENPSRRAVQDLFKWVESAKLPITRDGHLVAYKYVRQDYKDQHSGTFDNSVGAICEMPRNQVVEDPNISCAPGLHFCSFSYLGQDFGKRLMLVKVNPRDVVSFPDQYQMSKARCCRYEVIHEIKWAEAKDYFMDSNGVFVPPAEQVEELQGFYIISPIGLYYREFGMGLTPNRDEAYVFYDKASVPQGCSIILVGAPDERSILERIIRIEDHLGLSATSTIAGRLDAIDRALGLEPITPVTARLDRAESQLGLS